MWVLLCLGTCVSTIQLKSCEPAAGVAVQYRHSCIVQHRISIRRTSCISGPTLPVSNLYCRWINNAIFGIAYNCRVRGPFSGSETSSWPTKGHRIQIASLLFNLHAEGVRTVSFPKTREISRTFTCGSEEKAHKKRVSVASRFFIIDVLGKLNVLIVRA